MPELKIIHGTLIGCDPELFLSKEVGKVHKRISIVGSEQVVPMAGLADREGHVKVVRDGVQVEFQPLGGRSCREYLRDRIGLCFQLLQGAIPKDSSIKIDLRSVVHLSKGDLLRVSPENRELGCKPSLNAYGRKHVIRDGQKMLLRSASGHIHLGCPDLLKVIQPEKLVNVLDVLVGNTCVLIDRDPEAAIRRRVYGRAGEYRLPKHGLEYRTLSNFWLRSYPLMSLVMAMARQSVYVVQSEIVRKVHPTAWDASRVLMQNVDLRKVEEAINTNSYDLAMETYLDCVRPFLEQLTAYQGIHNGNTRNFDFFVSKVKDHGLGYWFNEDPVEHWTAKYPSFYCGWERFLDEVVGPQRLNVEGITAPINVPVVPTTPQDIGSPIITDQPTIGEVTRYA